MRIKTALSLSSSVSIIIIISLVLAIGVLKHEIRIETGHLAIARNMRTAISQRSVLGVEFYIRHEDRPLAQARLKTEQLASLFDQAYKSVGEAEHTRMLSEMMSANESMVRLFEQYISSVHSRTSVNPELVPHSDYEKTLYTQVQLKSYTLQAEAESLETWHFRRLDILSSRITLVYSISFFILIILVLVNGIWISKKLSNGVERLREGAARLGAGDLAHRLAVIPDDEISDVAREINTMAESLAASFTSIRNLEHEVTQRERAEEEIRRINDELEDRIEFRTAQLESANKELETFAYSVAHDLRAPLRSIDGFTKIIQESYEKVLDDEGRRILGIIRASDQKMDELIKNLLEITRIGKTELSYSLVDMKKLATESFNRCADPIQLAGFEVSIGDLPSVMADASMMEQIWLNLLSNAVKYSMPSSEHRIEIRGKETKDMLEYSVRDYGVGFDAKYTDKLFVMFQRLHAMENFPGTGIGLAMVKKAIQRHNGTVHAKGETGKGAMIFFSLPARS